MTQVFQLSDVLWDSPKFRNDLARQEENVERLEAKLERVMKTCSAMVEAGKHFFSQQAEFLKSVDDVGRQCFFDDDPCCRLIRLCVSHLKEFSASQKLVLDHASKYMNNDINAFLLRKVKPLRESRNHFMKLSNDFDSAVTKAAAAPKSKPQDCDDAQGLLLASRSAFLHSSLNYVEQLTTLNACRRQDILSSVLSLSKSYVSHYRQGYEAAVNDVEPLLKDVGTTVSSSGVLWL
ncbi:unnamed protein product [Cyprideis torosa]|uniref:Uncharacterized protein n=1 Tax=Cyprideis torosa TaxID=163714 RepID=A0A7R8WRF3_9CRUS|nr:unnamed protein product [Cyprideis torosa]CAG0904118.1 unnamed protein product [Cyprideis torosa]